MALTGIVFNLLSAAAAHPVLQSGAIVAATFVLEDAATVLTGIMAADGTFSPWLALLSLYLGIALGDAGLYALGRLAATHRWARRWAQVDSAASLRRWLEQRLITTVLATRFLPGTRLPTYTACGFLGLPFRRFVLAVVAATLVWTTMLFGASLAFGAAAVQALGVWRWPVGLLVAFLPFALGRLAARRDATPGPESLR